MRAPIGRFWRLLAVYLRPLLPLLLLLAAFLCTGIALELAAPQLLRAFIDGAQAAAPAQRLVAVAALFMGVTLLAQLVAVVETWSAEAVGWSATNRLRADVALHCLTLDASFHSARTPGELVERIDGDVTALAGFFSRFLISVVGNALLMLGVLALLYRESWQLGLAATVFAVVTSAAMGRIYGLAEPLWREVRQRSALFWGFVGERLAGAEDLRTSGAVAYTLYRFTEQLRAWWPLLIKAELASQVVWMVALTLLALATATALGLGAALYRGGAITIGTIYLVLQYVQLLSRPIGQLQAQIQDLQQAGASVDRVDELMRTPSRLLAAEVSVALPNGPLAVELDHVTFSYGLGLPALDGVSMAVAPRAVLGLLGHTGSGKTSVARLLSRLYDPTLGSVRLDGVDLRHASLADVRRRVGYVTQDVQLFHATVRDNLTFFDASISDERLLLAIDELGLGDWFHALSGGLDTELAGAMSTSAGEAQLLAFVRVLLKDPGLVILDEASSRLDPFTERLIEHAVDRLLRGRTGIVIAHRLATVERADDVAILEGGRLVEHGARTALAADPTSRFAKLLNVANEGVLAWTPSR